MNDLSYFIEVHSQKSEVLESTPTHYSQEISIKESRRLEEYLEHKDSENKKKTLEKLEKIETNQHGRKTKIAKVKDEVKKKTV